MSKLTNKYETIFEMEARLKVEAKKLAIIHKYKKIDKKLLK